MTDEELINYAHKWLDTPELQKRPNERAISFIASVCLQWRQTNKISFKQRQYLDAILYKHSHK
jgi:hypothetical protein